MEQDGRLAERLSVRLGQERMAVTLAGTVQEGLEWLERGQVDLVCASDRMPDMNGEAILIAMRKRNTGIPVMLFASDRDVRRRIRYYRLGANDVLPKPLVTEEVVVRMWNLLKLSGKSDRSPIQVGDLTIDPGLRMAEMSGESIPLTPTEFDLLLFLARNEGKPLSRRQILQQVWGYPFHGQTNLVDVYIRYLRNKIDKKYRLKFIRTVRGIGYRFDADKS